jgi:DNA polymerase III delta prime subunit
MATLAEIETEYTKAKLAYRANLSSKSKREAYEAAKIRVMAARDKIREDMPRGAGFTKEDRDNATF